MDMLKRSSGLSKKMASQSPSDQKGTGKKSVKTKKKKSKRKLDKENGTVAKGSSSPQSPTEGEYTDPQSPISDNPDCESDGAAKPHQQQSVQRKDTSNSQEDADIITSSPTMNKLNYSKQIPQNTAKVNMTVSSNVTVKLKKTTAPGNSLKSSQSTRIKESVSQTSLSSKSSKTSSNNSSSKSSINQSYSRTDIDVSGKKSLLNLNESLRWEKKCDDPVEEEERINQYKLNRRKRYLAASNQKYSDWVKTLNGSTHGVNSSQSESNTASHINGDHSSKQDTTSNRHLNRLSNDSIKTVSSSSTNSGAYLKTVTSVPEVMVSGLAGNLNPQRTGSQVFA